MASKCYVSACPTVGSLLTSPIPAMTRRITTTLALGVAALFLVSASPVTPERAPAEARQLTEATYADGTDDLWKWRKNIEDGLRELLGLDEQVA